jgi:nucleoside-diphosphate-sugar epimerase
MRALVTGGTGFVGGHLVEALHRRGDRVTALVRSPAKSGRLVELGATIARGDLDDESALARACEDQDVVFHVAGVVAARDERSFLRANRDGTRRLLRAAERSGSHRFVLVSSLAAAGPSSPGHPLTGGEPPRPITAYGRSKLAGEAEVEAASLPWTIVRPPMVFGPGDREMLRVFETARRGFVPLFGRGDQELSFVFGPDLAEALVAVSVHDETIGKRYFACDERAVTSGEFARAVGRSVGREVRVVRIPAWSARPILSVTGGIAALLGRVTLLNRDKAHEFLAPAWTADPSGLRRDAGWSSAHSLERALEATADWYQERGWLR